MLTLEDIRAEKRFLLGALIVGLVMLGINFTTGFFTHMHLENEEAMALQQGDDSALYKQMVGELIDDLHSDIDWEKQLAAVELGHLGVGASKAIPDLELLLNNKKKGVRTAAALALARIGHYSVNMVAPLIELLQGPSDHEKYWAAKALGLIGPGARKAIPLLQHELKVGHADVKEAVRESLKRIGAS